MSSSLQVSFLPWAGFEQSIVIGPITFWPYYKEADQRINDPEVRLHLDRHFKSHVDHQGSPVKTITVCSYGDSGFRPLNDEQTNDLRDAVNALLFASIAPHIKNAVESGNHSLGPATADVFEWISLNFVPGIDHLAVRAGSLTHMGLKIDNIFFSKPWATGGMLWKPSASLVDGLSECFAPEVAPEARECIFRSLEWFRMVHLENNSVSALAKVVMMVMAFEVLLQFKMSKWKFVAAVQKCLAHEESFKGSRPNIKGEMKELTLADCWAWDFYELRNRIVHGAKIEPKEFQYSSEWTHGTVADVVFLECVKYELFKNKCIGNDRRQSCREIFPDSSDEEISNLASIVVLGNRILQRSLGWIG